MNFKEYQEAAASTAKYKKEKAFEYLGLGLGGEAGEVAGKLSKVIRDNDGVIPEALKPELKKELGDVLWFISELARNLGYTLEDVAQTNVDKLASRAARGVISGSGDNR